MRGSSSSPAAAATAAWVSLLQVWQQMLHLMPWTLQMLTRRDGVTMTMLTLSSSSRDSQAS
jgi:hypothetical protein